MRKSFQEEIEIPSGIEASINGNIITMKKDVKKVLNSFINDSNDEELEFNKKVAEDKAKYIKSDHTIIERLDKQIITEDGRMLLREQY